MAVIDVERVAPEPFIKMLCAHYPRYSKQLKTGMGVMLALKWLELGVCQNQPVDNILNPFYGQNPNTGAVQELVLHQCAYAEKKDAPNLLGQPGPWAENGVPQTAEIAGYFLRAVTHGACRAGTEWEIGTGDGWQAAENRLNLLLGGTDDADLPPPRDNVPAGAAILCAGLQRPETALCSAVRLVGKTTYLFDAPVGAVKAKAPAELLALLHVHHNAGTPNSVSAIQVLHTPDGTRE